MDPINSSNLALVVDSRANDERARTERWLATLAHELRDPLSAIIMSLDELRQVCGGEASASQTRQIAMDSALHMSKVIEDVLNLCRTHAAKPAVRTDTVDLSRIVIASVRCAHLQMARRRHHLSVSLPTSNLMIRAHPSRLQQILTNLLVNAAKYTAPGGEVALDVQALEDVLVISVRDNGVGMAPAFVSEVFSSHWNTPPGQPSIGDGLGIGLALVQSLVKLHGGTVTVHSEGQGKGTEFIVRLPNCVVQDTKPRAMPLLGMAEAADSNFAS